MTSRRQLNSQRTYDRVIDIVSVPAILREVSKVEYAWLLTIFSLAYRLPMHSEMMSFSGIGTSLEYLWLRSRVTRPIFSRLSSSRSLRSSDRASRTRSSTNYCGRRQKRVLFRGLFNTRTLPEQYTHLHRTVSSSEQPECEPKGSIAKPAMHSSGYLSALFRQHQDDRGLTMRPRLGKLSIASLSRCVGSLRDM